MEGFEEGRQTEAEARGEAETYSEDGEYLSLGFQWLGEMTGNGWGRWDSRDG